MKNYYLEDKSQNRI